MVSNSLIFPGSLMIFLILFILLITFITFLLLLIIFNLLLLLIIPLLHLTILFDLLLINTIVVLTITNTDTITLHATVILSFTLFCLDILFTIITGHASPCTFIYQLFFSYTFASSPYIIASCCLTIHLIAHIISVALCHLTYTTYHMTYLSCITSYISHIIIYATYYILVTTHHLQLITCSYYTILVVVAFPITGTITIHPIVVFISFCYIYYHDWSCFTLYYYVSLCFFFLYIICIIISCHCFVLSDHTYY